MKAKRIIWVLFILFSTHSFAQLKFEGTVDSKYKTFQLDDGSFKYVLYNKEDETLQIFNLDNTLWRTVKIPLPENHVLDELKNISVHTFNTDDLVELIYSCAEYHTNNEYENPSQPFVNVNFTLNIVNELGEQILKVHDSNEMEIINSGDKNKLIIYKHIGKGFQAKNETLIYSF